MGRFLYGVCGQSPAICNGQTLIKKVKAVYTTIDMQ